MSTDFTPSAIERQAQQEWKQKDVYRVTEDPSRDKFYACSMLPYPSGKLHMGHVRNYTINDALARHLRMKGFNVLMPMGWDAFGLPAENAALKNKVPPAKWTRDNIAYMKRQMQALGLAIDWSREVATCDASYYKWNQWFFLQMLKAGIAERRTQLVNWDPVDQTVLANEQVIDGRGWRSGALVEKREIPGYYLNITRYADELLAEVQNNLPGWPERVKLMQENWIGRSEGVRFAFPHTIAGDDAQLIGGGKLYVFTTRADTIMGVTFCAVAPEHPLALHAAKHDAQVAAFIQACQAGGNTEAELATQEKKGVPTGLTVRHPLSNEVIPVWVGNYVLMSYGDGAVMGVPAHDERDFEFAQKHGIDMVQVIHVPKEPEFSYDHWQPWYADKTRGVTINSDIYSGLKFKEAVDAVAQALHKKGLGDKKVTWRLRDWGISRQRYWGTPIPIIHCAEHGPVPVPEKDLPVVLPEDLIPDGSGNPLKNCAAFLNVPCPTCGKPAQRETDTMDTFVDSSWYFMRYCDPSDDKAMVAAGAQYWMPMDQYIGGIEHAILHLLYARFWTKVMRDLKLVKVDEPFKKLLTQGMVLNHVYSRKSEQGGIEYFGPHEVENTLDDAGRITGAKLKSDGSAVNYDGVGTMSKSKNNGVDPQSLIDRYGADTARLFVMFAAPPEQTLEWSDSGVEGAYRFLRRVWEFCKGEVGDAVAHRLKARQGQDEATLLAAITDPTWKEARREIHVHLKQATFDYERMQYNTVVSACMKLLKVLESLPLGLMAQRPDEPMSGVSINEKNAVLAEGMSILLRVLYPICPHLTWTLWRDLGFEQQHGKDLLDAPWPEVDEQALVQDEIELMLQINGKLRGSIRVAADADKATIEKAARASAELEKFMQDGLSVKRVIVVPGRLVNVVLG
jgi:leucyl-tRNA synthetase